MKYLIDGKPARGVIENTLGVNPYVTWSGDSIVAYKPQATEYVECARQIISLRGVPVKDKDNQMPVSGYSKPEPFVSEDRIAEFNVNFELSPDLKLIVEQENVMACLNGGVPGETSQKMLELVAFLKKGKREIIGRFPEMLSGKVTEIHFKFMSEKDWTKMNPNSIKRGYQIFCNQQGVIWCKVPFKTYTQQEVYNFLLLAVIAAAKRRHGITAVTKARIRNMIESGLLPEVDLMSLPF